ncbi:MAG: pilus assembly protein PilM, partial [Deltaproteobacteria bacterium]|nr:pilus assembly protein PilM [Deltaproteobacteria bacterium]
MISSAKGLGIDIGDKYLAVCILERGFKKIRVVDQTFIPFISLSKDEKNKRIKEELLRIKQEHPDLKSASITIPRKDIIYLSFNMPSAVKENLSFTMRYEIGKKVPFSQNEYIYDFQLLNEQVNNSLNIMGIVVLKKIIDEIISLFSSIDIKIINIEPTTVATFNLLLWGNMIPKNGTFLNIDIRDSNYTVDIINNGVLMESRLFPIRSTELLAEDIAKKSEILFYGIKRNLPDMDEIDKAFFILPKENKDIISQFEKKTGINSNLIEPTTSLHINLLPEEQRPIVKKRKHTITIILASLAFILFILWGANGFIKDSIVERNLKKRVEMLRPKALALLEEKKNIIKEKKKIEMIDKIIRWDLSFLNILKELTVLIPETAYIESLD